MPSTRGSYDPLSALRLAPLKNKPQLPEISAPVSPSNVTDPYSPNDNESDEESSAGSEIDRNYSVRGSLWDIFAGISKRSSYIVPTDEAETGAGRQYSVGINFLNNNIFADGGRDENSDDPIDRQPSRKMSVSAWFSKRLSVSEWFMEESPPGRMQSYKSNEYEGTLYPTPVDSMATPVDSTVERQHHVVPPETGQVEKIRHRSACVVQ